jgi:hypothetical protein
MLYAKIELSSVLGQHTLIKRELMKLRSGSKTLEIIVSREYGRRVQHTPLQGETSSNFKL